MEAISVGAAALKALGVLTPRRRPASIDRRLTPVRRGSVEAGTFEQGFFVAPAKGETNKVLKAAKHLSATRPAIRVKMCDGRQPSRFERAVLGLNRNTIAILEELLELARTQAGKVYPTYAWLVNKTGISRATVARALVVLEALGFIVRQRRFKRVEVEGVGPRYKQTSNAYRIALPARILSFLPHWLRKPPVPVDHEQRTAEDTATTKSMLAGLGHREYAVATVGGMIGAALAKFGAALDRNNSESQYHSEPSIDSIRQHRTGQCESRVDLA